MRHMATTYGASRTLCLAGIVAELRQPTGSGTDAVRLAPFGALPGATVPRRACPTS